MAGFANSQGSNSAAVRELNERVVLTALRRLGEASKTELAWQVKLTQNAAGQIVRDLERRELVVVTDKRSGLRGQPATLLQLNPKGAHWIGIKLGRRTLDSALVDFSGEVLYTWRHEHEFPMPEPARPLHSNFVPDQELLFGQSCQLSVMGGTKNGREREGPSAGDAARL